MSLKIVMACALMLIVLSVATAQAQSRDGEVQSSADGSFLDIRTGSVSIPLNSIKKPATDLLDPRTGQNIDTMEAVRRMKAGEDLSVYNPQVNKIWQNKNYSILERPLTDYPDGEKGVQLMSVEADGNPYTGFYRVQAVDGKGPYWRLSLSLISQSTSIRSALLRKLGYDVVTPKAYGRLRIFFPTLEKKKEFFDSLELKDMNLESRGWILENKPDSLSIVVGDALLETQRNESVDWHWGFIPNPNSISYEERSRNLAWIEYYSKFRAYRALIIPFSLVFIPESIERFSPKLCSIVNDYAILYHPLAGGFASVAKEDAKWLLSRMSTLTEKDFKEILSLTHYPDSIKEVVYRKTVLRARNLFECFKQPIPATFPVVNLDYTSPDGLVVKGRVTKEKVPGYPQRFTHGDRESPFKDDDWWRYAGIRSKTAMISTAFGKLNEKLQLLKLDKAQEAFGKDIVKQVQEHFQNNPGKPLDKGIQSWGGPVMGFNMNAARHVATGTYYGSTAAVQLVDMVSASMSLGYINNFEKFPELILTDKGPALQRQYPIVSLSANASITRAYIHVKPLYSMKDATKVSWKDLLVPSYMADLAKTIDSKDVKDFREFIRDLKEGEVFTITDSLETGLGGRISSPLDFLLGLSPLSFINSVSMGADASRVVLRQTSIVRTRDGIQIFVRNQTGKARGVQFDADYFIKIMSLRAQNMQTELKADAFVLDYKADWEEDNLNVEQQTKKKDQEENLRLALMSLLRSHGTEKLYTLFPYQKLELEHIFKTNETKAKFLMMNMIDMNEDHELKIRYPKSEDHPELDPKDEEISLFRTKRGRLEGMDLLGFAISGLEAWLNKKSEKFNWDLAQPNDPNPANIPFGKAFWRQVVTERDLSGTVKDVSLVQHVWGGWHLSREKFMKLIDEIIAQLGLPQDAKYRLVEKESFHNVTGVDFYRVSANLSIRHTGLDKLRDLVIQPEGANRPGEKAKFLGRLFQKISEKLGGVKSRQADRMLLEDVMTILGNGNLQQGRYQYQNMCQQYFNEKNREQGPPSGFWVNGSFFDCLTPWAEELMKLSVKFPKDKKDQIRWMTEVVYILEEQIPMPQLLKYLGSENVIYFVQVNGFRSGDEDGDLSYISNTWGNPPDDFDEANGVFQFYARKTGVISTEIDRSQGSFR